MFVKDLREMLEDCNDEDIVIMSSDPEGNSYSPLDGIYHCGYVADNTYSGELALIELTENDIEQGYTEEDVREDAVPAVILRPTN